MLIGQFLFLRDFLILQLFGRDTNLILPVKWCKGHFFKKSCFSPVKNVKKCRGRDLNSVLPVK